VTGGDLRHEAGGSTDLAAWIPVADVAGLVRSVIIGIAMGLESAMPPDGHLQFIPVSGVLRH